MRRKLLWIIGGFFAFLLIAAIALPLLVRVDSFRPRIEAVLSEKLHREVKLGALGLRLLPLPTVTVASGSLAGAKGEKAPLVEFKQASARVALWPLLRKQVEVRSVDIDGLTLNLVRDRAGKLNLQTWLAGLGEEQKPVAGSAPALSSPRPPPPAITLGKLRLSAMHILYTAPGAKTPLDIPLDLTLTGFGSSRSSLTLIAGKTEFSYDGRLDMDGLDGKFGSSKFRLEDVTPLLNTAGAGLPSGFNATGSVKIDGALKLDYARPADAALQATLELSGGTLQLPALKVPLTGVTLAAQLTPDAIEISKLAFKLLKSDLSGHAKISNWLAAPRMTFEFSSELLEIGELANQLKSGGDAGQAGNGGGAGSPFSATGSLQVKNGGFGTFRFSAFKAHVAAAPAQVKLIDLSAQFFKGVLNADAVLSNSSGSFSFNARLQRMDLGEFMKAAAGEALVTGSADAKVNGQGRLANWQQLTGNASVAATNGIIAKFPLLEKINQALSLTKLSTVDDRDLAYDRLTADFTLGGAKARTENLQLHATLLDADAKGAAAFDTTLDFAGHAVLSKARSSEMIGRAGNLKYVADKEGRITLPFTAKGKADAPSVTIDTSGLLKQAASGVVEEKKGELQQKAKERVTDYLGGLLGGSKSSAASSPR